MAHITSTNCRRLAFTLVELLVSITIIVLLASAVLYGMASVQTTAKVQRTKGQIARLSELLAEKWEEYEYRRVDVPVPYPPVGQVQAEWNARVRLQALRQLMRYEMPDRASDILPPAETLLPALNFNRDPQSGAPSDVNSFLTTFRPPIPASARYFQSVAAAQLAVAATDTTIEPWSDRNQGAECLYMIASRLDIGDASALELFSENEIGDTDGDGMRELLDSWGRPIEFIRWPAGFDSPRHPPDTAPGTPGIQPPNTNGLVESIYADPFDPMRVGNGDTNPDTIEFAVYPLIYSAGPDEQFGIRFDVLDNAGGPITYLTNDPFVVFLDDLVTPNPPLGIIVDKAVAFDNIHNHEISTGIR